MKRRGRTGFDVERARRIRVIHTTQFLDPENNSLADALRDLPGAPVPSLFLVDDGYARHRPTLAEDIEKYAQEHLDAFVLVETVCRVPGGEAVKSEPSMLEGVLDVIHQAGVAGGGCVVAIGGGAFLDLVSFACAVVQGGIEHVRVPTTTTAQAASSALTTGIHCYGKRNWLSTTSIPWAILHDGATLDSLSEAAWRGGFAHVLSWAVHHDLELFEQIEAEATAISERKSPEALALLSRAHELSFQRDARSSHGNGATPSQSLAEVFASALEEESGFAIEYGEALSVGLAWEVAYSALASSLDWGAGERILESIEALGLPLWSEVLEEVEVRLENVLEATSRRSVGRVSALGRSSTLEQMDPEVARDALRVLSLIVFGESYDALMTATDAAE